MNSRSQSDIFTQAVNSHDCVANTPKAIAIASVKLVVIYRCNKNRGAFRRVVNFGLSDEISQHRASLWCVGRGSGSRKRVWPAAASVPIGRFNAMTPLTLFPTMTCRSRFVVRWWIIFITCLTRGVYGMFPTISVSGCGPTRFSTSKARAGGQRR